MRFSSLGSGSGGNATVTDSDSPDFNTGTLTVSFTAGSEYAATKITFGGVIEHMVPASFFDAAAKNEVLQIVFFAIIMPLALLTFWGMRMLSGPGG